MRDLHLVDLAEDGSHLVLGLGPAPEKGGEGQEPERFRLVVDRAVIAAVRGERPAPRTGGQAEGQLSIDVDSSLRPAQIQARIRAGATAEDVAREARMPLARVQRYEGAVLDERRHVAELAQKCPPRRGPNSAPGPLRPLGELVRDRLEDRGIDPDDADWNSARLPDGRWRVTVDYPLGAGGQRAQWLFDPRDKVVLPQDDQARWLVGEVAPGLRSVVPADEPLPTEADAEVPAPVEEAPAVEETAVVEEPQPGSDEAVAEPAAEEEPAAGHRRRAGDAAAEEPTPSPRQGSARPRHASGRGRRASVPSWDDIVFGTRVKDQ